MRPIVAFITAVTAGMMENLTGRGESTMNWRPDLSCPTDGCCDELDCPPEAHRRHHSFLERLLCGLRYAFTEFWDDLAGSFFIGLLLAGIIAALIPESLFTTYLGNGLSAMLIMLAAGIPLYICATASTPIAATLILKGVSPGAALVFLLAGPATNVAALTILVRTLGKRSTAVYLVAIAGCTVMSGVMVDGLYRVLGVSAQAVVGQATEAMPYWMALSGAIVLLVLSLRSFWKRLKQRQKRADESSIGEPTRSLTLPACNAVAQSECGST
jgi:hypothetical protein